MPAYVTSTAVQLVSCGASACVIVLQGEADREWFVTGNARDVDHVITTAELGKVLVERGIKLNELEESAFDNPLGEGSGGGLLFGTTGGVMEAALRTVYELVSLPVTLFWTLFTSGTGWEWARQETPLACIHQPAAMVHSIGCAIIQLSAVQRAWCDCRLLW